MKVWIKEEEEEAGTWDYETVRRGTWHELAISDAYIHR